MGQLNYSQAREYAVEDGLIKAFKTALLSLLPSDVSQEQFKEVWQALYADRDKYVVKFGITDEFSNADAESVTVRVTFAGGMLAEQLHSLGYETVQIDRPAKDIILTVGDVQSYEEYAELRDFLRSHVPCVREVRPSRLSWREISFHLTLQGNAGCITEVEGPFVIKQMADEAIKGVFRRSE